MSAGQKATPFCLRDEKNQGSPPNPKDFEG